MWRERREQRGELVQWDSSHPHSKATRVTERFHRRAFGHMEAQIPVNDSTLYTKPFTIKLNKPLLPDTDLIESFCLENEKDRMNAGHVIAGSIKARLTMLVDPRMRVFGRHVA